MCAADQTKDKMPPIAKSPQAYQWMRGDAYKVGTEVRVEGNLVYNCEDDRFILMRLSHTGELAWVDEDEVEFYPSTPIPTP